MTDPDRLPHHADARAQLASLRAQLAKRPDGYVNQAERDAVRRLEAQAALAPPILNNEEHAAAERAGEP